MGIGKKLDGVLDGMNLKKEQLVVRLKPSERGLGLEFNRLIALFLFGTLSVVFVSCDSFPKRRDEKGSVSYSEFRKILIPVSRLHPLEGGEKSLILLTGPEDPYPRVYELDHKTRKFTLYFDAGQPISRLVRDRQLKDFYIMMDKDGDENYQIYSFDPRTKATAKLFGNEGRKVVLIDFSKSGDLIFVSSNHEREDQFKVYEVNVLTGETRAITGGELSFTSGRADHEGRYLALERSIGNNEQHIYLLDIKTKKLKKLIGKKNTVHEAAFFDPLGKSLYVNSDEGRDRTGCGKIQLGRARPKMEWVQSDRQKDLSCHYNELGEVSIVSNIYDGRIEVSAFQGVFGKPLPLKFPERSLVSQFTLVPNSRKMTVSVEAADSPANYFVFDLDTQEGGELERISEMNQSSIQDFAKSYDVDFKSFDGLRIHGILYAKPSWVETKIKRPVILWPHGGPDHQEMHVFHPFFQYWVQKGFVVFAPNFRGSTGYGKKFETLNDRDWGGGHIKDLIEGKRAISDLPYVDPENIFIVGGSFGGYSTLSAITQYPTEFNAAVAMMAVGNLFTFMESIPKDPAWQLEFLKEVGDPVKDKALFQERSPIFAARRISIPLKIYQAENDVRTVKAEMDTFVDELRRYNIPVEYEVLEKEGHGLSRAESWEKVLEGTAEFLLRQVKTKQK